MANMQTYEMMVILKPDLNQKQTDAALDSVRGHIADFSGKIEHEDLWGKRTLTYLMKGYAEGYYAIFYYTMEEEKIAEFKKELDLEQTILRKMIVKFPKHLSIDAYLDEAKKVTSKLEAEEEEKRKVREENEKKARARRGEVEKEVAPKEKDAEKKTTADEVDSFVEKADTE